MSALVSICFPNQGVNSADLTPFRDLKDLKKRSHTAPNKTYEDSTMRRKVAQQLTTQRHGSSFALGRLSNSAKAEHSERAIDWPGQETIALHGGGE